MQNLILEEGQEYAVMLYTWRCCSRAIPQVGTVIVRAHFFSHDFLKYRLLFMQYLYSLHNVEVWCHAFLTPSVVSKHIIDYHGSG